jgi:uncharacterized membrane protein YhaH (DUF805 family)
MALYQNFVRVMENYAVFEGRASRSEFWWYVLATVIFMVLPGNSGENKYGADPR